MSITQAAQYLREGKLVAIPTETVYGLGANAYDDRAVAEIYAAKGRPQFNPLIMHVANVAAAMREVMWNARAETLAKTFWPGPLTLVLPRNKDSQVSLLASAGLDTMALRIPAHPLALELLNAVEFPVAAPSANRSGRVSPTLPRHVREEMGDAVAMILDGGACSVGVESTVVDLTGARAVILRPGGITKEQLEAALGEAVETAQPHSAITSPGMLASHYAPSIPVRLNALERQEGEVMLAFGPNAPRGTKHMLNLSEKGDLREAAANLFAFLRSLDSPEYTAIAVMPIPEQGLGAAINDRLKRAAS